jgi:hypothetical protein
MKVTKTVAVYFKNNKQGISELCEEKKTFFNVKACDTCDLKGK